MSDEELERLSNYKEQICRKNCEKDGNCFDCWTSFEDVKAVEHLLEEYKKSQQDNKQLKEQVEDLERIVGIRHKRNLILKFDKEYDEADKKKNPNRNYAGISPDAEEVYKRYYEQKKVIDETINHLDFFISDVSLNKYDILKVLIHIKKVLQKYKGDNNE